MTPLWLAALAALWMLKAIWGWRRRRLEARAGQLAGEMQSVLSAAQRLDGKAYAGNALATVEWMGLAARVAGMDGRRKRAEDKALSVGAAEETLAGLVGLLWRPARSPGATFAAGLWLASEAWGAWSYRAEIAEAALAAAERVQQFWA
jgi:hypothetical protein